MAAATSDSDASLRQQLADSQREVDRLKLRLDEEVGTLRALLRVSGLLNSTLNLSELLRLIMSSAKELLAAEVCSILLLDDETGELVFEVSIGEKSEEVVKHRIPVGEGIAATWRKPARP